MLLATRQLTSISNHLLNAEIPLPLAGEALIAVPDLVISISPIPPVQLSHRRPKPQPHMLDGNTIQLASRNENIVILWSLE